MTTPVSYEIAKMLKEKEFGDFTSPFCFHADKKVWCNTTDAVKTKRVFAPTIAGVVMWLYEKHGIWISVLPELYNEGKSIGWYFSYYKNGIGEELEFYFKTPTESYDAAITYTLNNLI